MNSGIVSSFQNFHYETPKSEEKPLTRMKRMKRIKPSFFAFYPEHSVHPDHPV
jgi:hypothetical protein